MTFYPDIRGQRRKCSVLPEHHQRRLIELRRQINSSRLIEGDILECVRQLAQTPVRDVGQALDDIRSFADLHGHSDWQSLKELYPPRSKDKAILTWYCGLEYLFTAHGNGYIRERALNKIDGPLRSAFWAAAVIYRLNDWVGQVRAAALACVNRTFPDTDAETIAETAYFLLPRRRSWLRGHSELEILDAYFSQPEVIEKLVQRIARAPSGPAATVLGCAFAYSDMDRHLSFLAENAVQPAVRALALKTLIAGEAAWTVGIKKQWLDKSLGEYRFVPHMVTRRLDVEIAIPEAIRKSATARWVSVRKIAMQSLVDRPHLWSEMRDVVRAFETDPCASIREGADYIIRMHKRTGDEK